MDSPLKRGISGSGPPTNTRFRLLKRHSVETEVKDDGTLSFIFRPHTFSALLIMLSFVSYFALYKEEIDDFNFNMKRGLIAVALNFLAFGKGLHIPLKHI